MILENEVSSNIADLKQRNEKLNQSDVEEKERITLFCMIMLFNYMTPRARIWEEFRCLIMVQPFIYYIGSLMYE